MYQTSFNSCELPNCYPVSYDLNSFSNLSLVEKFTSPTNGPSQNDDVPMGPITPGQVGKALPGFGFIVKSNSPSEPPVSNACKPGDIFNGTVCFTPICPTGWIDKGKQCFNPVSQESVDRHYPPTLSDLPSLENVRNSNALPSGDGGNSDNSIPDPTLSPPVQSELIEGINNSHIIIIGSVLLLIIVLVFTFSSGNNRDDY
jgi:hypothetical protein